MLHWEIMRLRAATSVAMLIGAVALAFLTYEIVTPTDRLEAGPLVVEVPAHEGALDIAHRLQRADRFRSRAGFVLPTGGRGRTRSLQAGEPKVQPRPTTLDVVT